MLLRRIRQCLYQDGYTIRGAQKLLGSRPGDATPADYAMARNGAAMPDLFPLEAAGDRTGDPGTPSQPPSGRPRRRPPKPDLRDPDTRAALEEIRRELLDARRLVDQLVRRRPTQP